MRVLLDTHVFLWAALKDKRLSKKAHRAFEEADLLLSVVSIWEMALKFRKGNLELLEFSSVEQFCGAYLEENSIEVLDLKSAHIFKSESLPAIHNDPFDRMIVAQAMTEHLPILTGDSMIRDYGVRTIW